MNDTADILRKAKALIDTPEKWTKGADARNESGAAVDCRSLAAVSFSFVGAMARIIDGKVERVEGVAKCIRDAIDMRSNVTLNEWSDEPSRTHAEVMSAFDAAIAIAKGAAS